MTCTEKNFIRRLKKQKEDALEYIMMHYGGLIHGISHHILGSVSKEAVEECVNDIFLIVWQRVAQFDGDVADFKKWIGMIAKYKAIDYYRTIQKQQTHEQSDELLIMKQTTEDMQQAVLLKEQKNELLVAISNLAEMDRDIFMMKYFLQMPSSEIAETLQLSITAVDNRLFRGRKKLAQSSMLKEQWT